jgi:hypothetical protein
VFTLNFGLRAGGGLGDALQDANEEGRGSALTQHSIARFFFDVGFFIWLVYWSRLTSPIRASYRWFAVLRWSC